MADDTYEYLGAGLTVPFYRDSNGDFANSVGLDMIDSSLMIIFGTLCAGPTNHGEVPYNQELGTLLPLLRHRNINDENTQQLGVHYTMDKVPQNEKRVKAKEIAFRPRPDKNRIQLRMKYDVVKRDTSGVNVVKHGVVGEYET